MCARVAACLLAGEIPKELSALTALTSLNLAFNQLSGECAADGS